MRQADETSDGAARPDIDQAFAHIARGAAADAGGDPLTALRRFVDAYGGVAGPLPVDGVTLLPVTADGVAAEWIVPAGCADGARLVYLHGGGWVAGGLVSHRPLAAALARETGAPVLLVDYRLAPEHPFPAGLDDCRRALAWAARFGPRGEAEAARLYIAGDSAGGNLAAAACQQAVIAGARVSDRLVLLSPVLDGAANPARGEGVHPDADRAGLESVIGLYLQGAAVDDARVSPLNAPDAVLAGMPPCLLQVSAAEYLRWDSEAFARRLVQAGARATLSLWPRMPHVWHAFLDLLPEAREAVGEIAGFLAAPPSARSPIVP